MQEGKISFRDLNRNVSILVSNAHPDKLLGTHFTRFTCTKAQILTRQALLAFQQNVKRALGKPKTPPKRKPDSPISPWSRAQKSRRAAFSASAGTQFTCFTVQKYEYSRCRRLLQSQDKTKRHQGTRLRGASGKRHWYSHLSRISMSIHIDIDIEI
jgi:hypothetical protein